MYWGRGKNYDIEGAAGWQPWVLIRMSDNLIVWTF